MRTLLNTGEDAQNFVLLQRLLLHELENEIVENVAVFDENLPRFVVRALDQPAYLVVDRRGDLFGVVALMAHIAAQENLTVLLTELAGTELLAHAVLRD